MNPKALKARSWEAHCDVCGKSFRYQDGFECEAQPGRHVVAPKYYYHLGAGHIQDARERRKFTPTLNLVADLEVRDKVTGMITRIEGLLVHFRESGRYETTDPLEQYHLDMHPAVMSGQDGLIAWEKMYLTQDQQLAKAQAQLADVQKQIRESNALLTLTRNNKEKERDGMAVR
jgi:hypothetical protein